jgi:RNA polymerase sigma factor (sigma-70 family)
VNDDTDLGGPRDRFPTTRFSVLVDPRAASESERKRSMDALISAYWKPVYKHIRVRWKASNEDAKDLTQAFFARAASKDFFATFDRRRARFRTFLRHCLDGFVMNGRKAERRLKRGAGAVHLSLDFEDAEAELDEADLAATDIDALFDREWYRSLLASAVTALRAHCEASDKREHFAIFERYDLSDSDERPTYEALGKELGIPATTVTNRLNYARRELRRLAIEVLREVTADEAELESETRLLFGSSPR